VRGSKERFTGYLIVFLLGLAFVIGGMVGGIFGGGLILWATTPQYVTERATPVPTPSPTLAPSPTATTEPRLTPTATRVLVPTPSVEDILDDVIPAVVTIINEQQTTRPQTSPAGKRVVGSGIVIGADGYIVTNAHVVEFAQTLSVILSNGEELVARLVVSNQDQDLALLKVESNEPLVTARWGDSNRVRIGQPVLAIGSPLGDFPNSVTMGIVSGLNRALALNDVVLYGLVQTDAAINQGNSGGPLVNLKGEVIGINTFIIRTDHEQSVAEGIGFAIPASSAKMLSSTWISQAASDQNADDAAQAAPPGTILLPAAQPVEAK